MDQPIVERRQDTRFGQPLISGTQAILRPGYAVALINLSAGGALIQGPRPLRPGARVHLQLLTGTRRLGIAGHVLRCAVASLDSRQGVQYRGALRFDHKCESFWEVGTLDGFLLPGEGPGESPGEGHTLPTNASDHPSPGARKQE